MLNYVEVRVWGTIFDAVDEHDCVLKRRFNILKLLGPIFKALNVDVVAFFFKAYLVM